MATLKDIAEKVGISTAAVSQSLSGKGRISPDIREKVIAAAHALGYQSSRMYPHTIRKTAVILISLYETEGYIWDFIKNCIVTIQEIMNREGYTTVILPLPENQQASVIMELMQRTGAAAVFSLQYSNEELFRTIEISGIPLVIMNDSFYQRDFNCVCVDDYQGAYEACRVLIDNKHRRIGYIDYPREFHQAMFTDRYVGFRKALEEEGISMPDHWRLTVPLDDPESLKTRLTMLLKRKERPSAFLVHDDFQAGKVYHIVESIGLSIPEDISLIAPGDTLNYRQPETPQISTMKINTFQMGHYAAHIILEELAEATSSHKEKEVLKLKQQLVDRGSICRYSEKE